MTLRLSGITLTLSLSALSIIACGSNGSEFGNGDGSQSNGELGSAGDFNPGGDGTSSGDPANTGPVCAAQEAAAARKPIKLIVILDQSKSMGDGAASTRWIPVTTALKGFLAEQTSDGIEASMRLFPKQGASGSDKCKSTTYTTPNVPMTILPNALPFTAKLVADPNTDAFADTPTRAVLKAAVGDAKLVAAANPTAKVAIVLITDGQPRGCSAADNAIDNVAGEVAGTKSTIPTYVIGVGDEGKLDKIATTGGPRDAFIVSVGDEAKTRDEFLAAIDEIRGATLACDVDIPPPPAGQTLDPLKVNVNYTPTAGAVQKLKYDEACAGEGWRYDDKANPKQVILCPTTCTTAKKDPAAKLSLEFGCVRRSATVQ